VGLKPETRNLEKRRLRVVPIFDRLILIFWQLCALAALREPLQRIALYIIRNLTQSRQGAKKKNNNIILLPPTPSFRAPNQVEDRPAPWFGKFTP
jgi:hypothetical protein